MISDKSCITKEELSKIKLDVGKNKFFDRYNTKRNTSQEKIVSKEKCVGLFFIRFASKDNVDNIYVPYLKTEKSPLFNSSLYEGKKILKDTTGMSQSLVATLKDMENNFTKPQLDSIMTEFLYGVYSIPIRSVY